MYYLFCYSIYLLIIVIMPLFVYKKASKEEKQKYKDVLIAEMHKGLTQSDLKSRRRRVKVLPLWQRLLYWLWISSNILIFSVPPILLCFARYVLLNAYFIPEDKLYYLASDSSWLVFGFGAFIFAIPFLIGYSYLSNRGVIRKADLLYQLGSFQDYPKKINMQICTFLIVLVLPIMIMSFNSYTYIKTDEIVVKTAFSVSEKHFSYDDLVYVERKIYTDDAVDYNAHFDNNKTYTIHSNNSVDLDFEKILMQNNIPIKNKIVKPLIK